MGRALTTRQDTDTRSLKQNVSSLCRPGKMRGSEGQGTAITDFVGKVRHFEEKGRDLEPPPVHLLIFGLPSGLWQCPKFSQEFRDITWLDSSHGLFSNYKVVRCWRQSPLLFTFEGRHLVLSMSGLVLITISSMFCG